MHVRTAVNVQQEILQLLLAWRLRCHLSLQAYEFDAYKQIAAVDEFLYNLLAAARRRQQHVGVIFMESFSSCGTDAGQCDRKCSRQKEHKGQLTTSIKGGCWLLLGGTAADCAVGVNCSSCPIHSLVARLVATKHMSAGCNPMPLLASVTPFCQCSCLSMFLGAGHNTTWHWCNRWWAAADIERPVVRHYRLPVISWRDAVWPALNEPRPDLPCLWNGETHPDAIAHSIIGDVVTYGLLRALMDGGSSKAEQWQCDASASAPIKMFNAQMDTIEYCQPVVNSSASSATSTPAPTGTLMSVFQPSAFEPVVSGSWYWREDVPGKPGELC